MELPTTATSGDGSPWRDSLGILYSKKSYWKVGPFELGEIYEQASQLSFSGPKHLVYSSNTLTIILRANS